MDSVSKNHRNDRTPVRRVPALQCYLAYISALLSGMVVWRFLDAREIIGNQVGIGFAVTITATLVIWVFSIANGNSSVYDPYWVIAPPLLAIGLKVFSSGISGGSWSGRQVVIVLGLCLWAARYHLFYAWPGWRSGLVHEDWRYEKMRDVPVPYWLNSLFGMHLFPTVLVYSAFLPAAFVLGLAGKTQPSFGLLDMLGAIGMAAAISIQLASDSQLARYRGSAEYRRGGTLRRGLWRFSRHPNYFGEVLFWLSMVPFASAAGWLVTRPSLVVGGPILMAVFFRFSCWLMDKRSIERRPGYRAVVNEVSALVPWWPKTNARGETPEDLLS